MQFKTLNVPDMAKWAVVIELRRTYVLYVWTTPRWTSKRRYPARSVVNGGVVYQFGRLFSLVVIESIWS
jgi:hypothetical protein